jgi:hypothetical protein
MRKWLLPGFFIFLLASCARPKGSVVEDRSLLEVETVKFCFTGDMGKDGPHQAAIADALNGEGCHRIFFLGDLVYPKGIESLDDPELTQKFLAYYEPLLQENPELVINLVLGNHDHKGDPTIWKRVPSVNDRFYFPNYYYMVDYGGLCVVALDTSFYYYLNDLSEIAEQTAWIQGLQGRLKNCDLKIAVTHHPYRGVGLDPDDDWEGPTGALESFLEAYVIGVFDVHLAGHVHVAVDDGEKDGTRMLISGAGGETRGVNRPGYFVLSWKPANPKRLSYALREIAVSPEVVDEGSRRQEQEEEVGPEWIIPKRFVEAPFWAEMIEGIGAVFENLSRLR